MSPVSFKIQNLVHSFSFIVLLIHLPPTTLINKSHKSTFRHVQFSPPLFPPAEWMRLLKQPLDLFLIFVSHTPWQYTAISRSPYFPFPHRSFPPPSIISPPFLQPHPSSLTLAQWTGALLLADGLFQTADDAVLVPETLAVGGSESLHLAAVLDSVPLQLDPVLVSLLLQLLEMGVLLQKTQQVGHHCHQGRLCQLCSEERTQTHAHKP